MRVTSTPASRGTRRTLLYLHGFASSPGGAKAQALQSLFSQRGIEILAPDLNQPSFEQLSFSTMSDVALKEATRLEPLVIAGSSLGALVALDLARRGITAPLVLIAPALGFGTRWTTRIPAESDHVEVYHYGSATRRRIHRQFFEEMEQLSLDQAPPPVPVLIVMGTDDESVPYEKVRQVWERWSSVAADGSDMITIQGGDHGLTSFLADLTSAISRAVELAERGTQQS